MHIQVRDRVAILKFETGKERIVHDAIIKEMVCLLDFGFNQFILDFADVDINFNSIISGFVITATKKLLDCGCSVKIQNIKQNDMDLLLMAGLEGIKDRIQYIIRGET